MKLSLFLLLLSYSFGAFAQSGLTLPEKTIYVRHNDDGWQRRVLKEKKQLVADIYIPLWPMTERAEIGATMIERTYARCLSRGIEGVVVLGGRTGEVFKAYSLDCTPLSKQQFERETQDFKAL